MRTLFAGVRPLLVLMVGLVLAGCEKPPVDTVQRGYRGLAMETVYNPRTVAAQAALNAVPDAIPPVPDGGPLAKDVFKNVQVLGDLGVGEFTRTMQAITAWVSPVEGCAYCHKAGDELSADSLYTKVVARKMLQMTRQVNGQWKAHVAETGVTCYTCHRGQPVPAQVWFTDLGPKAARGATATNAGQNHPATKAALTSLPLDPFTPFLLQANEIRMTGTTALPEGNRTSIKQAEWTFGLMTHMSKSLGVNCTYCHNSRAFNDWSQSPPQRVTAWAGIRMVRELNNTFMEPLTATFPDARRGPLGDVAKVNCATCHNGAFKPLYGAPMAKDHGVALGTMIKTVAVAAPAAPVAAAAPAALANLPARVLFGVGKKNIDAAARQAINLAAASLMANASAKVSISGFADKTGNADKNLELAKERAFAVRDALKAAGIDESRIELKKPEFVVGGTSAESRRVDINPAP